MRKQSRVSGQQLLTALAGRYARKEPPQSARADRERPSTASSDRLARAEKSGPTARALGTRFWGGSGSGIAHCYATSQGAALGLTYLRPECFHSGRLCLIFKRVSDFDVNYKFAVFLFFFIRVKVSYLRITATFV